VCTFVGLYIVEVTAPQEICTEFNRYVSSVGETLIKNSHNSCIPGDTSYQKYCEYSIPNSMFCNPVTEEELAGVIAKLNKSSKSFEKSTLLLGG